MAQRWVSLLVVAVAVALSVATSYPGALEVVRADAALPVALEGDAPTARVVVEARGPLVDALTKADTLLTRHLLHPPGADEDPTDDGCALGRWPYDVTAVELLEDAPERTVLPSVEVVPLPSQQGPSVGEGAALTAYAEAWAPWVCDEGQTGCRSSTLVRLVRDVDAQCLQAHLVVELELLLSNDARVPKRIWRATASSCR